MASTNGVAEVIVIDSGFPESFALRLSTIMFINNLYIFSKLSWEGLRKQLSQGIRRHSSKGTVVSLDKYKT